MKIPNNFPQTTQPTDPIGETASRSEKLQKWRSRKGELEDKLDRLFHNARSSQTRSEVSASARTVASAPSLPQNASDERFSTISARNRVLSARTASAAHTPSDRRVDLPRMPKTYHGSGGIKPSQVPLVIITPPTPEKKYLQIKVPEGQPSARQFTAIEWFRDNEPAEDPL